MSAAPADIMWICNKGLIFPKERFGPAQLLRGISKTLECPVWQECLCLPGGHGPYQIVFANNVIYCKGLGPCGISLIFEGAGD